MKLKKSIIVFSMVSVMGLVTLYSLQLIHAIVVLIFGFGVWYIAYTGILFFVGIWLIIRYGFYLNQSGDIAHMFIFSSIVGIGIGGVYAALIGMNILLMRFM